MISEILATSLLAGVALAAPAGTSTSVSNASPTGAPPSPPYTTAPSFTLVANVTNPSACGPSVQYKTVSSYHVQAGLDYLVLTDSASTTPISWFGNGTFQDIAYGGASTLTLGGGNPFALFIQPNSSETVPGKQALQLLEAPSGSPAYIRGVPRTGIAFPGDSPALGYTDPSSPYAKTQFYTCPVEVNAATKAVQDVLFERFASVPTPAGCTDLTLVPQCAAEVAGESSIKTADTSAPCYKSVKDVNWNGPWFTSNY